MKALKLRTSPVQIWKMASCLNEPARAQGRAVGTHIPKLCQCLWLPVMGLPALGGPGLGASGAAQTNRCC